MADLDLRFHTWRDDPSAPRHRSLWIEQALAKHPGLSAPFEGDAQADVCIIGGGFTGLWTAIRLREQSPSTSVTLLEADFCGAGASGRNSGGTGTWWGKLSALIRLVGRDEALTVLNASIQAVRDIEAFTQAHGIDCHLRHGPSVWAATAPAQVGAWELAFRAAETMGLQPPWRRLEPHELRRWFGECGPTLAGVVDEHGTWVHPALLARGLYRTAISMGVRIYERTPVTQVHGDATGLTVHTERGRLRTDQVVLAANAWMAHLPEFRPHIAVMSSDIVATDPIPEILKRHGLRERPNSVNSRMMLNYGGITSDGRVYLGRGGGSIAFNGRVTAKFDRSPKQMAEVEADFRYLYPELNDVPITTGWSGPVDRSTTGLPWFGRLKADTRVSYGIGYSGHGVGATALGGRILASLVLGRQDQWMAVGECLQHARRGSFPPEPVRYVGAHLVRAAVARKELAERERRQPSRLDKALAKLAPATISEFKPRPA